MARILVFDSGVGGLSILGALQQQLHDQAATWLFCSDNAFFPYGTRPEQALVERVTHVIAALDDRTRPDVIVIACNTASTVALEAVRARIPTPIVGVVPAIKPAAALTRSGVIGLLATPGTIRREYTHSLIREFAADHTVIPVGSSDLVWMAEDYLRHGTLDWSRLATILAPLREAVLHQGLDTVVLACTHFPLVAPALRQLLPEVTHWVDSGAAVARRVAWCLEQSPAPRASDLPGAHQAILTQADPELARLQPVLARYGLPDIHILPLQAP